MFLIQILFINLQWTYLSLHQIDCNITSAEKLNEERDTERREGIFFMSIQENDFSSSFFYSFLVCENLNDQIMVFFSFSKLLLVKINFGFHLFVCIIRYFKKLGWQKKFLFFHSEKQKNNNMAHTDEKQCENFRKFCLLTVYFFFFNSTHTISFS